MKFEYTNMSKNFPWFKIKFQKGWIIKPTCIYRLHTQLLYFRQNYHQSKMGMAKISFHEDYIIKFMVAYDLQCQNTSL